MDQSSFAAPHSLSQRITSFIACACQGIHQLPLRHLIVLIANAHHLLDLEFLSPSLSLRGVPNLTMRTSRIGQTQRSGYLLQPNPLNDAIDVFNRHALLELRRAARLQSVIKTSFSRSNPVPRGQATVIRSLVRDAPKDTNNERSRVTGFPPTSDPSPISGRLGHRKVHRERFRTPWVKTQNTWKPPDQSSLHNVCRTGIRPFGRCKLIFLQKTMLVLERSIAHLRVVRP
jgi:hypothetical protein